METFSKRRRAHLILGRLGERDAAALLKSKGYLILATNCRVKAGELDIVALDGTMLVFAEVKTLRREGKFRPGDNLGMRQFRRNIMAARYYCKKRNISCECRFDLIEVVRGRFFLKTIRHHSNIWHENPEYRSNVY